MIAPYLWGSTFSEHMDEQRELIMGNRGGGGDKCIICTHRCPLSVCVRARASCYCPLTCVIARPVIMCQLDSLIRIHLKCNANVYTHSRRDCVTMTRGEREMLTAGMERGRRGEEKQNKKILPVDMTEMKSRFWKQAPRRHPLDDNNYPSCASKCFINFRSHLIICFWHMKIYIHANFKSN